MQYTYETYYRLQVNKYSLYDKVIFVLYTMYFVFAPFYFWTSGLPQIADLILVLLIVLYAIKKNMKFRFMNRTRFFLLSGLAFVVYVTYTNLTWMMILSSRDVGVNSFFYLYNFLITVLMVGLYTDYGEKIVEVTNRGVLISVSLQTIMFLLAGGFTGTRMKGVFSNPNQLGYYALMVASIQIYLSGSTNISTRSLVLGLVLSSILVIASLSTAAIVSYSGLVVLFVLTKVRCKKRKYPILALGVIALLLVAFVCIRTLPINDSKIDSIMIQSLVSRARVAKQKASRIMHERGYDRIIEYPEYLIFGAGEGEYLLRFGQRLELHSTLGNILVSYGIIGIFLFSLFVYLALKNDGFKRWYVVFAIILVYGLVHNGIRNSMLWMLLGLVATGGQ